MIEFIEALDQNKTVFIILAIGLMMGVSGLIKAVVAIHSTQAREKSRREIAAYIAEGSITPEQGERLMKADVSGQRASCM
jgi:hypothetical protein